ncbi:hypothetical protein CQ12_20925 [Bradyrhizobium jicamae]|uniref:Uncharacterized protein n=1 Tax=Bradyrhizobium jicamae TaxID=280332 RepID=A0A0R3KEK9_9BRAD|nr:hypothetical protein CQ12_20925 [Bradyrhizobium jicamae]
MGFAEPVIGRAFARPVGSTLPTKMRAAISWYHPRFGGGPDMIHLERQRFRITMEPRGGRLEV